MMSKSMFCDGQSSMPQKRCEKSIRNGSPNLLKSTIPRPLPRHHKSLVREVLSSSSSCLSQPTSTQIPVLQLSRQSEEKLAIRIEGKSPVHVRRYPYSNVKAKVDSNIIRLTNVQDSTENSHNNGQNVHKIGPLVQSAGPTQVQLVDENVKLNEKSQMIHLAAGFEGSPGYLEHLPLIYKPTLSPPADPLSSNLKIVIEDQKKLALMVTKILEQCEGLTDVNLKCTHEQEISMLKEHLDILRGENKELGTKYKVVLDEYDQEKQKVAEIKKNMTNLEDSLSHLKTKCINLERKEKAMKASRQFLWNQMRIAKKIMKIQHKKYRRLLKQAEENIIRLKSELAKSYQAQISLENANKDLREDLEFTRMIFDENKYKRNELIERLLTKDPALRDIKEELEEFRVKCSNTKDKANSNKMGKLASNSNEDLDKQLEHKNNKIQELTASMNHLENILKEKLVTENMLMSQVTGLQRQLLENTKAKNLKVKKMQLLIKSLSEEKTDLVKIIAQKCLELGHQELLMQEQLGDISSQSNIPNPQDRLFFRQQKTFYTQGFYRSENQSVKEEMKTFEKHFPQDSNTVVKEKKEVNELYSLLEEKQMEVTRLEHRLLQLQKAQGKEPKARVSSRCCFLAKAFLPKENLRNYWDLTFKKEDFH